MLTRPKVAVVIAVAGAVGALTVPLPALAAQRVPAMQAVSAVSAGRPAPTAGLPSSAAA